MLCNGKTQMLSKIESKKQKKDAVVKTMNNISTMPTNARNYQNPGISQTLDADDVSETATLYHYFSISFSVSYSYLLQAMLIIPRSSTTKPQPSIQTTASNLIFPHHTQFQDPTHHCITTYSHQTNGHQQNIYQNSGPCMRTTYAACRISPRSSPL
jgi:hypothetical protein